MTGRLRSFDVAADGRVVVVADGAGTPQPWLLGAGDPVLLPVPGAVQRCVWHPDGRSLLVLTDPDGRENNQLIAVDTETGAVREVHTEPGVRHELGTPYATGSRPVSPDGRLLAFASTARTGDAFDVLVRDLESEVDTPVLRSGVDVEADRYFPALFSPDSRTLLVHRLHQNTEHALFTVALDTGEIRALTPLEEPAKYLPAAWRPEGIYLCATRDGDHTSLGLLTPDGELTWIAAPEHDIEYATVAADGSRLAWFVNEDGFSAPWHCPLRAGTAGTATPVPGLPPGSCAEEFGHGGAAPQLDAGGRYLTVLHQRTGAAPQLWRLDLTAEAAGATGAATAAVPVGTAAAPAIAVPEVVRFTASDGVTASGLLHRPPGDGPFPAVLHIHGGPEAQALPTSDAMIEQLVRHGVAVLACNVRGSSGYGLRYQRLIYRDWGGGDLLDFRAAAEFLAALPWVAADRLGVYGASYGGFASLTCLTRAPEFWRAGAAECAVADQVDDIRTFPPTWQRRAVDWVGDITDPADRARLTAASPLSHVDAVRAPILLVHGTNDTRASITSVDAFHRKLLGLGRRVDYHRVPGGGHELGQQGFDSSAVIADWLIAELTG